MTHLSPAEPVAIAVVMRDRFSTFPLCLDALYAHTRVRSRVIVVAGGPDPSTRHYLQRLQALKGDLTLVLADHFLAYHEACRLALQEIRERYFVIMENDTVVGENWLAPMLQCMREEGAAAVMPLIHWYRGVHAVGCTFEREERDQVTVLRHAIVYTDVRRKRIDYPESHCVLFDRERLAGVELFDDVEPSDVDLGLTLQKHGASIFFEPRSTVTYSAPPRWEMCDVGPALLRWDAASWIARNERFIRKWQVAYDSSAKRASYRRLRVKLALLRWYPSRLTLEITNLGVGMTNQVTTWLTRGRRRRSFG